MAHTITVRRDLSRKRFSYIGQINGVDIGGWRSRQAALINAGFMARNWSTEKLAEEAAAFARKSGRAA